MTQPALELVDASKSFNGRAAVRRMSFVAPTGGVIGFLGPNGAGKSTTLRMALGVIKPDSGHARLFGAAVGPDALRNVGFLPEERGLYRRMNARSVIAFYARLKGMSHGASLARADELLEGYGLGAQRKTRISRLSKGMAQKVQILAAIAHRPDLIILDEPFSGLDPVNQQELEALIRAEHARGATIVFSTHVMEHAERLCDRLVIIGNGEKRFDGLVDEALALLPSRANLTVERGFNVAPALGSAGFVAAPQGVDADTSGDVWRVDIPQGRSPQDVLRAAIDAGAPIIAFSPVQTRLRDVFVSLTAKHAANDDADTEAATCKPGWRVA